MASINYFFKSVSEKFSFDDYVYGLNENAAVAVGSIKFNAATTQADGIAGSGFLFIDTLGQYAIIKLVTGGSAGTLNATTGVGTSGSPFTVEIQNAASAITIANIVTYIVNAATQLEASGFSMRAIASVPTVIFTQLTIGTAGNTTISLSAAAFSTPPTLTSFRGGAGRTGIVEWAPTTGTMTAVGIKLFDNYIFSPKHYGYFSDTFYSPPDKYYFTNEIKALSTPVNSPPSAPVIVVATLTTGSYRLTSNTDVNLRIMARYVDGETSYTADETYYETL